jgi:hypothetical protein
MWVEKRNCDREMGRNGLVLRCEKPESPMSQLGQSRRFHRAPITSGLPREADIFRVRRYVSKVPTTEVDAD